jgi:SAM-dependent methyltransferase
MNDNAPLIEALEAYFQLMNANGAARVYHDALRLGILDAMRDGATTPAQVAAACRLQERPTALLLDVLCAMGLARRDADSIGLSLLAMMLLSGSYRELGNEYWDHLPALLATGRPLVQMDRVEESESHYQGQAAALAWMLSPSAEAAAAALGVGTSLSDLAILDVGAGSAIWSLSMCRRDAGTTTTALDWPAVLEIARQTADGLGLADRLTLLPGDFHDMPLPAARFDLAIVANVSHLQTPADNQELFVRVRAALKPGGRIAVIDVMPGQQRGDLNRALYGLGLALRTEQGQVYAPQQLEAWLSSAGFGPAQRHDLAVPPYVVGMLVAAGV